MKSPEESDIAKLSKDDDMTEEEPSFEMLGNSKNFRHVQDTKESMSSDEPLEEQKTEEEVEQEEAAEAEELKEEIEVERNKPAKKEKHEKKEEKAEKTQPKKEEPAKERKRFKEYILNFLDINYKKLLIIPIGLFILSILIIGLQVARTGDFINKDISLKGGTIVTIPTNTTIDLNKLSDALSSDFKENEIDVRDLSVGGSQSAIIITSDLDGTKKEVLDSLISSIEKSISRNLNEDQYSVEFIGSSLGGSFFKEVVISLLIAFLLMGIVVIIYFRKLIPALIVILCVFCDIIVTLAIVNLTGMRLNTAGIAAFLMLIGYSVDTDILLSTKVLKTGGSKIFESTLIAMKTGLMMTLTTIAAVSVGLIFTTSDTIRQIMIIVLIGLVVDMIYTWIQNVGILRWYVEKKGIKHESQI